MIKVVSKDDLSLDETYQDYINRVARQTLPESHETQLKSIQSSPKFVAGKPAKFPGYTISTPLGKEDPANGEFYHHLTELQQEIQENLGQDLLIMLPPATFHLTLADLIWENSYRHAIEEDPNFEAELRKEIKTTFEKYRQTISVLKPITWQLLGLVIRPRAIVACLVPKDRESYEAIIQLRRCVYQNRALIGLGIEQQYDYTAHVTLGYFGEIENKQINNRLLKIISKINTRLVEVKEQILTINQFQLHKFDTMIDYYREPDWAIVKF